MYSKEVISKINQLVAQRDLVAARRYMEQNSKVVNANKYLLSSNARELLIFLNSQNSSDDETLSRTEMVTVSAINSFANKFDVNGIKFTLKNKEQLLSKKGIWSLLNKDAKVILKSIGAI